MLPDVISMSNRSTTLTSCLVATVIALAGCAFKEAPEEATAETPTEAAKVTPGAAASPKPPQPVLIQQRWWNWAAAEETATNPVADRSGADCARNQPDDLWFFAGSFGGAVRRTCSVPAGRPIVAPVVNVVAHNRTECVTFLRAASGSAKLDGKPLTVERMDGEKITYRGVDGNPISDTSDEYAGTACGLWITIPDPAPGAHTLTIQGKSGSFAVRADYTFKVAA
jgi:hypothetical protein